MYTGNETIFCCEAYSNLERKYVCVHVKRTEVKIDSYSKRLSKLLYIRNTVTRFNTNK